MIKNLIMMSGMTLALATAFIYAQAISYKDFKTSPLLQVNEKEKLAINDPIYLFVQPNETLTGPAIPIRLTDHLIELLKIDDLYDKNDIFPEVVNKTQEKWLALVQGKSRQAILSTKASIERIDLKDSPDQNAIKEKVEKIARAMGIFDKRDPALSHYQYGAWLGAFLQGVRNNLKNLVIAWENGFRFEKLVIFTGERYLRKEEGQEDDIKKLCDFSQSPLPFKAGWKLPEEAKYETEYDMMKLVFDQVQLPKEMEEALINKIEFVNAAKGQHLRPSTKDCYVTWLSTKPAPGAILAVSYPLFWVSQQITGQNTLGNNYPLDTIAPALSEEEYERKKPALVSIIHDTVAKCLYEINNCCSH